MKKKIFLLTVLTAVFALLLCTGAGAYSDMQGQLIVNDTDILKADNNTVNCGEGTVVYDSDSKTLTLTNATITVPDYGEDIINHCQTAISVGKGLGLDLEIVLVGENKIITNHSLSNGIYVGSNNSSLKISGEGSLSITCNNGKSGIYSDSNGGDIIIDGVTLDIRSEGNNGLGIQSSSGDVTVKNRADVSCISGNNSIYASNGSITIENSSVSAVSTDVSSKAIASYNNLEITNSTVNCSSVGTTISTIIGDINISGSTVNASSERDTVILPGSGYNYNIYITNNSNVTVERGDQPNSNGYSTSAVEAYIIHICDSYLSSVSYAEYSNIFAWYELKIVNSTVEAYNKNEKGYISIYCESGPVLIENSEVHSESDGNYAIRLWEKQVTISNSVVTALSNSSTGYESIATSDVVYITDSWVVTDNGYRSSATYYDDSVSFEDGRGQAYGDAVLPGDVTVPEGYALVLREDEKLTIPVGVTLTNYGTVQVLGGCLTNNGIYMDYGETLGEIGGSGSFPNNWFVTISYGNGAADELFYAVKGRAFILPDAPSRPGYIFLGWRCGQDTFGAGDAVDITSNTAFQAVWANMPDIPPYEPDEPVEPVEFPFTDVSEADWYYDAVYYVWANGVMEGVEADEFAPNSPLTRAMVWAMLARLDGVEVSGDGWVAAAQEWAVESGVSDGTDPTGYITREQLVTMLWRCKGSPAVEFELTAPDAGEISDWALEAMRWAAATGLIEGDEFGNLTPTATSTRAQAATFMLRFGK